MKYWKKESFGSDYHMKDDVSDDDFPERVLLVRLFENEVRFREGCDEYFSVRMPKDKAVEVLMELVDFIENGCAE